MLALMIFGFLLYQLWPLLCSNLKNIKVFNRFLEQVLWRIQITNLHSSTFIYDESYDRGGDLQKRVLKIAKTKGCQGLLYIAAMGNAP